MALRDVWPIRLFARGAPVQEAPAGKKKNNIIKKLGLAFLQGGGSSGRDNFEGPEGFDFEEIEKAYLTDSYIRSAMDKYVDFIFKAGWDFVGKNPKNVEYIKQRFAAIQSATSVPTDQLLIDIAEELIKYHNCFIVKARQPNGYTYPPGVRATPVNGVKPVAGYFILPTQTVTISRDKNGTIKRYQQEVEGEDPIVIKPEDMIHIYVDKQPGRAFGFPFLWEVLDDVKLLRQLEELVDRMIYKNIFPLMIYKVGLPQEGFTADDNEIEEVREMLGDLSMDGGIVMPERHNLTTIGAEGKALGVEGYLRYFEQRVFTGLGVSDTLMGRGDTVNRSTSDNLDAVFKDRIKAYQKVISMFINAFLINELLLEGGIDTLVDEKNKVEFRFKEIDFDSKIKEENHAIQKFTQNAITHEELRNILGMDPVTEEDRLYFKMITATINQLNAANNQGDNKDQPANQYVKKTSPGKERLIEGAIIENGLNETLASRWEMVKADTVMMLRSFYKSSPDGHFDASVVEMTAGVAARAMGQIAERELERAMLKGMQDAKMQSDEKNPVNINYSSALAPLSDKTRKHLEKLINKDLISALKKTIESSQREELIPNVVGVFEALKFRIRFLATTEINNAYNQGFAKMARAMGYKEAGVIVSGSDDICAEYEGKKLDLYNDKLPPFHANCSCKLTLNKKEGS